ncbi:MAG: hypothetical protein OQK73_00215 [Gammaproteobacteria bacterium]|nr:hypothetical protein [Gammaproteobacteria bacterium]
MEEPKITGKLAKSLDRILTTVEARKKSAAAEELKDVTVLPVTKKHRRSARQTRLSIEQFQQDLFNREIDGRFTTYPVRPSSEFPTFLTRIPIFLPIKRGRDNQGLDIDNAMPFMTSWGRGRKHGPPLTVYDEDTLMAVARLRKARLFGRPHNLPIPIAAIQPKANGEDVSVHLLTCSLSELQSECDDSDGGTNMQLRLASVKRLGATVIELDRETHNKLGTHGTQIKLIDIAWETYDDKGLLLIQFSPIMAAWLESEYTYIDWSIRKQLSDTGKALHRFLSAQPKKYSIYCEKLMSIIGYQREYRYFMGDLRSTMKKLSELEWMENWEIVGTGRKVPHKLTLKR